MTPAALDHVEIYVSDIERTRVFWGWFFDEIGWVPHQDFGSGFSYKNGQSYIVFVQANMEHIDAGFHRKRIGLNHLAFSAPNSLAVDSLAKELTQKGICPLYADRHPHAGGPDHYAVYFEDPDRIKVEYVSLLNDSERN